LRVPNSKEVFDNTDIHPEQYDLARYILKNFSSFQNIDVIRFYNDNKIDLIKFYPDVTV
jgi:transcriptional accessory protein Tex/SPT6